MSLPLKNPAAARGTPFPIPVVGIGPGSQPADEDTLDYLTMPQGMDSYRPPVLPEPEELAGHAAALQVLRAVQTALATAVAGGQPEPVSLTQLGTSDLVLVNQVLGEGEVSARVLPDAHGQGAWRIQEAVFAGIWRVVGEDHDAIEVGAVPDLLRRMARLDGLHGPAADWRAAPPQVLNAPPVLVELEAQRASWQAGQATHVVNLTLLPMTPDDIGFMDHVLGTGRVLILSRGYGNCRITDTLVPHTWRVVYFNSQDAVILNTVEVGALPDVARAAPEDLADSLERFNEVLQWVAQA